MNKLISLSFIYKKTQDSEIENLEFPKVFFLNIILIIPCQVLPLCEFHIVP